jgi:hypothetical protein
VTSRERYFAQAPNIASGCAGGEYLLNIRRLIMTWGGKNRCRCCASENKYRATMNLQQVMRLGVKISNGKMRGAICGNIETCAHIAPNPCQYIVVCDIPQHCQGGSVSLDDKI